MTKTDDDANEKYNEKVLTTGTWIDREFLEDLLTTNLQDEVKVLDFKVTAAVGAGDNYLSILYKTSVSYTRCGAEQPQQRFLMVKGVPTAKILLDMIEEMGVFDKEIMMYNKVLPAMQKYSKECFMPDSPHVAPESFICSRPNTLVMEDIGGSGYKMANRRDQLDLEHCLATLRTLARFHALSVKLYQDDPELIVSVAKEFYNEANREKMAPFLEGTFPILAKAAEEWGENARFSVFLEEFSQHIWDKIAHVVKPSDGFNVLNHGDMWVNNIMYKYDEDGSVIGAKLVDFQLSRYTSPSTDLHYFFFTSPKPDVLAAHMQEMLQTYHQALTADMAMIGLEVDYSFDQLQEDMLDHAPYGVLAMAQILPIVVAPPSELFDLDNMTEESMKSMPPEENPLATNYRNAYYRETAGKLLTHMENCGYMDACKERMQPLLDSINAQKVGVDEANTSSEEALSE